MLPDQFHWDETFERLRLRAHTLIFIDPGYSPVPLVNNMRSCLPRHLFFSSHAIAIRYAETWANKWEADIRLHVGAIEGAAMIENRRLMMDDRQRAWADADDRPCRHGQKRRATAPLA